MSSGRSLTFLGTGTSTGVPVLGCDCHVCTSTNPCNHRYRSSVMLTVQQGRILIDTPPELRLALLREKVPYVHAILLTHFHVDHLYGMDDVRLFPRHLQAPLNVYCNEETEHVVRRVFHYAFGEHAESLPRGMLPQLKFIRIEAGVPFEVLGEKITPVHLEHGKFNVLGFRIRNLAYCTDVSRIPPASREMLQGLDTLVLDALRRRHHPNHMSLDDAIDNIRNLQAKKSYLTHISHELEHAEISSELPEHIAMAYDGLKVDF
ncbi:MAG TPA: MBL fold metallo-hydrolase [Gemmatales bacterium]|nr:MBL fold metallo-hydrolase [Gemmatales bacterium]